MKQSLLSQPLFHAGNSLFFRKPCLKMDAIMPVYGLDAPFAPYGKDVQPAFPTAQ